MTADGGSPSRQEVGNGNFIRTDGGCPGSRMSLALMRIAISS